MQSWSFVLLSKHNSLISGMKCRPTSYLNVKKIGGQLVGFEISFKLQWVITQEILNHNFHSKNSTLIFKYDDDIQCIYKPEIEPLV